MEDDGDDQQQQQQRNVQDITVVVEDSDDGDDEANSQSSEEFNFAVAIALRKNLTETFDKYVDPSKSSVSDKIAHLEQKTAAAATTNSNTMPSNKPPPRPVRPPSTTTTPSTPLAVFLRVRPLPSASQEASFQTLEILPPSQGSTVPTTVRTYPPDDSNAAKVVRADGVKGVKEFRFHQVFGPNESQHEVYNAVASPLVHGLFPSSSTKACGESALLFAYGITNAGKTYTMMGDVKGRQSSQHWGIIPRALQDIFAHMEGTDHYELQLSYIEIYNEQIFDLLPKESTTSCAPFRLHHGSSAPLKLRESRDGQTFVRGLTKHRVRSVAQGLELAEKAKSKRHTSSNKLNPDSSRSHCICQLELVQLTPNHLAVAEEGSGDGPSVLADGYTTDEEASMVARGKDRTVTLWIVDLAGSERVKRTGMTHGSLRQKEAAQINASLMKLMRCLSVMRENQSSSASSAALIPFRESKLTHLFMNHLTGPSASRTCMIVNANPAVPDFDETQHVLTYAVAAKSVQITQEDFVRKRKERGTELEPTHDENGRALKRSRNDKDSSTSSKIAKLVKKFSPKRFSPRKNPRKAVGVANKKRKAAQGVATAEPRSKMSRNGSDRPPIDHHRAEKAKKPALASFRSYEKEISNLKAALSIAQAEAEVLRSEKKGLQEELTQQESNIRMEIAEEMNEQMTSTREHYNRIIEGLKAQIKSNPTPSKSVKKAKMDKVEQQIDELVDKVEECEEEMVRMREEHTQEIAKLHEAHEKAMDAKEKELSAMKNAQEKAMEGRNTQIETLEKELDNSRDEYKKLKTRMEEMIVSYERVIREQAEEESSEEDEEEDESEEEGENDPTPRVERAPDSTAKRLRRIRASKVAVSVDAAVKSPAKNEKSANKSRSGISRLPFLSVVNKKPTENPTESSSDDDSFGVDKWLRPKKPTEKDETGNYLRPRGRAPSGREWDPNVGAWRLSHVP